MRGQLQAIQRGNCERLAGSIRLGRRVLLYDFGQGTPTARPPSASLGPSMRQARVGIFFFPPLQSLMPHKLCNHQVLYFEKSLDTDEYDFNGRENLPYGYV